MKRIFVFILITLCTFQLQAQKHEVGLFLGGANGITDIGRTDYINPLPKTYDGKLTMPWTVGALYRFNLNPQQGLRLSLTYAKIIDNDRIATEDYRFQRGAQYAQNIYEAALVYEYNFFPINAEQKNGNSPYIFMGMGAYGYNFPIYTVTHQLFDGSSMPSNSTDFETLIQKETDLKFSYTIPFGAGYKVKFNYNWVIAAEIGVRPTAVDDLDMAEAQPRDFIYVIEPGLEQYDGVTEEIIYRNNSIRSERLIGDNTNNDWYVFTGLSLTYSFGQPPCFCD